MYPKIFNRFLIVCLLASFLASCSLQNVQDLIPENLSEMLPENLSTLIPEGLIPDNLIPAQPAQPEPQSPPISTPQPALPETIINFFVEVPIIDQPSQAGLEPPGEVAPTETSPEQPEAETDEDDESVEQAPEQEIYFSLLDEVTGLALNAQNTRMELVPADVIPSTPGTQIYVASLPMKIGSIIKYRYERQAEAVRVSEHLGDGSPVRYRLYYVQNPGEVRDVVGRWTDSTFERAVGRIRGTVINETTGQPIPNLLVTAGGSQSTTMADGAFLLNGLPAGVHNLVAYARDGAYQTFQQGAQVAEGSMTPAEIKLKPANMVKVIFVASLPKETPPIVPVRLAGNLYQLGNTFASLDGGMSSLAVNMPVLSPLPDGRYSVTLDLPAGADIRYKYTLGDGFWNAEHNLDGEYVLRQLIVPEDNLVVEDNVETWLAGSPNIITFDLSAPQETPAGDYVAIQFSPIFGWTEPLPMWSLGDNRWAYILFSPVDLPGNFSYRYCRNGQCGSADDERTPGQYGAGRPLKLNSKPQSISDQVTGWIDLTIQAPVVVDAQVVSARSDDFVRGVQFQGKYRPSWKTRLPAALDELIKLHANWVVATPTWHFGRSQPGNNPPILEPNAENDMLWFDLHELAAQAGIRQLNLALYPSPAFQIALDEWWAGAEKDDAWWDIFFDEYSSFALHHARFAQAADLPAIILGGAWVSPALPGGVLSQSTQTSGEQVENGVSEDTLAGDDSLVAPPDAESRWRDLFAKVRAVYSGQILWALPAEQADQPPVFLDMVDGIYLEFNFAEGTRAALEAQGSSLELQLADLLDNHAAPLVNSSGKPIVLAVTYPSNSDVVDQYLAYQALLQAVQERPWINGFVSQEYYPPAALLDRSGSLNGKPASELLAYWFAGFEGLYTP